MIEIVRKIDTNGDNLLSAGKVMLRHDSKDKHRCIETDINMLCFLIHRGDHTMDSARLQKICSGRCRGALLRV